MIRWRTVALLCLLPCAAHAQVVFHPPGGGAPIPGIPIPMEFGGLGSSDGTNPQIPYPYITPGITACLETFWDVTTNKTRVRSAPVGCGGLIATVTATLSASPTPTRTATPTPTVSPTPTRTPTATPTVTATATPTLCFAGQAPRGVDGLLISQDCTTYIASLEGDINGSGGSTTSTVRVIGGVGIETEVTDSDELTIRLLPTVTATPTATRTPTPTPTLTGLTATPTPTVTSTPSGGSADCTGAPTLACLAGRTGATNDMIISSDADGTVTGSADAASGLLLRSADDYTASIKVGHTYADQESLAIGSPLLSGFFPFSVAGDSDLSQSATLGLILLNGGHAASPIIFGIGAPGAIGAFTPSQHGDNLIKISGVAADADGALTFGTTAVDLIISQDGDAATGYVPGQFVIVQTNAAGSIINRFWIRATGRVAIGDDFGVPEGRFHVRQEEADVPVTVFQGAVDQTEDLTQWKGRIASTLAVSAFATDTIITLADSTAFPSSGTVYMSRGDSSIGTDLIVPYTANDTGTGELTLVDPLPSYLGSSPIGTLVYMSTTLSTVDATGGLHLGGSLTFSGAIPTCGTGCGSLSAESNDRVMALSVDSSPVTSVTVNFSTTLTNVPVCTANATIAVPLGVSSVSTSAVTFDSGLIDIGSESLYIHCFEMS